jgi:malate dehydrogenase
VPCKLGEGGLQEIIEVDLTEAEANELANSADAVRDIMETLAG